MRRQRHYAVAAEDAAGDVGIAETTAASEEAMKYRINRRDNGSKALEQYAADLGFVVHAEAGAIDAHLALGTKIVAVEWKSKGGTLTPSQQRLIARGYPVRFVSTPEQLEALKAELLR